MCQGLLSIPEKEIKKEEIIEILKILNKNSQYHRRTRCSEHLNEIVKKYKISKSDDIGEKNTKKIK